jgi:predicted dehydrogenase
MNGSPTPIRLALVGAGIFMEDAHLPSLLRLRDRFEIVAVYSRSEASARKLAALLPRPVQIFTDYGALLADPTIEAVDIVLPIMSMPSYISQALASGKHVISEKPIAPDLTTAHRLLAGYQAMGGQVWMVAENWRYESAFVQAAEMVQRGMLGAPVTCHWALYAPVSPSSKYYGSSWRESGEVPGGYLLDGGVHHVAGFRMIVGEIIEVSATVKQVSARLPPADTISAHLRFANGATGTYLANYSVAAPWPAYLYVVGDEGALRTQRGEVELTHGGKTELFSCAKFDGVEQELVAFASAIRDRATHRNTPTAGLADLTIVDALLRSAAQGAPVLLDR